jgi:tetratricopeptide (TPR) repeat protein
MKRLLPAGLLAVLVLASWPGALLAQASCDPRVGRFVSIEGSVEIQRGSGGDWNRAGLTSDLCEGDTIRVGDRSRAAVALINEAVLRINQNSAIRLIDIVPEEGETSVLDMVRGAFQSFSRKPKFLKVSTPYLNGSVEGTEFVVKVEDQKTRITVLEGVVRAANDQGEVAVESGQAAEAAAGQAPQRQTVVRPRDEVNWALYYPPILSASAITADSGPMREAADCAASGDTKCAFDALGRVPPSQRDGDYLLLRASLLLAVGRVTEAKPEIDAAIASGTGQASAAYALRAIIGVTQNDVDGALDDGRRAVELDPRSTAAKIALSYALQASLDLPAAREALVEATENDPQSALAWARLAELELMLGNLGEASASARRAVRLQPGLSRTHNVLGFTALAELDPARAKSAFAQAITLDSADPLPRLGLGLAKIRRGDLAEGRADLEGAVALDSNAALLRAYLGKAYFEEKRGPLDSEQYAIAKQLDPNDPTAFFYDAITKQTTNRPVEALRDMEKAIALNDNRAVYRSRLLLDSDRAARGASLARIYSDLGFQQLGLVEGWKSVNTDPSNSSAHRFLADTYAVLPRHEIARVSELLQSQLLQPLNATPIQPQLGESNLFLISALGPAAVGFNEFNQLFTRDGLTMQVSGLLGGDETRAGEAVVSGIYGKTSFSIGGFRFNTDGSRENADQKDTIANVFLQHDLSPSTSIQVEYRYRQTDFGDLLLAFSPESVFPNQRFESKSNTLRLGARHSFSPSSLLLGSFIYRDSEFRETQQPFPQPGVLLYDLNQPDQRGMGGELQHLFRSTHFNLTTGIGYVDVDDEVKQLLIFGPPFIPGPPLTPPTIEVPGSTDLGLKHGNAYGYFNVDLVDNMTLTIGASYDRVDSEYLNEVKKQFNPKVGITWNPLPQTTVRAAAFRTLNRTLVTQQTLEPTQVAGFNQFFDDFDLTTSRRYGLAVDQKFSTSLYGGLEFSRRESKVPYLDFTADAATPPTKETDWDEDMVRSYLYWTPHEWLALRVEYMFERLEREEPSFGAIDSKTHKVPMGVSFFHPSGVGASFTASYYSQDGKFGGYYATDPIEKGESDFWLVDLALNYRLPKRYGIVSVGATNLFDKEFQFFDSDLNNASIQPGRTIFGAVTIALP